MTFYWCCYNLYVTDINSTKEKCYIRCEYNKKKGLVYIMKRRKISENVLRFLKDVFGVRNEEDVTLDLVVVSIDVCKMIIEHEQDDYDDTDDMIELLEELEELLEFKLGEK